MSTIDWSTVVDGQCSRCRIDVQWHTTSPLLSSRLCDECANPKESTTMTENETTTTPVDGVPSKILTEWSAPAWANSFRQDEENVCWIRTPHITAFQRNGVETGGGAGKVAELQAHAYDWVVVGPSAVGIRIERETEATILVDDAVYSPAEARKLAEAILGLCDAVEQVGS